MDISYRNERVKEPTSRAKMSLIDLSWMFKPGTALDRLISNKNVPAKTVLKHLDQMLEHQGDITRAKVDEHRDELTKFRVIVLRRIEVEKADKLADQLARQAHKAGIGYQGAQSLFIRGLDRQTDLEWPDEGGW